MEVFEVGEVCENRADTLLSNSVHLLEVFFCEGVEAGIPSPFDREGVRLCAIAIKED